MARYWRRSVRIKRNTPSGFALREALGREFTGHINWGYTKAPDGMNSGRAIKLASNKRKALYTLEGARVPVPSLYTPREAINIVHQTALVGRTSYHQKGSGFWYCESRDEVIDAVSNGATHFMEFIAEAREFRVHIVDGNSIKISEKHKHFEPETGDFEEERWTYPRKFKRKISLRRIAKEAVEALGLDFGAVDILYKKIDGEPAFFVLEVNTCPCLTDEQSDTLERYVTAFRKAQDELDNDSF